MNKKAIYITLSLLIFFSWKLLIPISITNNYSKIISFLIALSIALCLYKLFQLIKDNNYNILIATLIGFVLSIYIYVSNSNRSRNHLKSKGLKTTAFIQKKDSYYVKSRKGDGITTYIYYVSYRNKNGKIIDSKIESYNANVFSRFSQNDSIDIIYSEKYEDVSDILEGDNQKFFLDIPMKDLIYSDIVKLSSIKDKNKTLEFLKKKRKEWKTVNNNTFVNPASGELLNFNGKKIIYESKTRILPLHIDKIPGYGLIVERAKKDGLLFIEKKKISENLVNYNPNKFGTAGLRSGHFKTSLFDVKYESENKNPSKKMTFIFESEN